VAVAVAAVAGGDVGAMPDSAQALTLVLAPVAGIHRPITYGIAPSAWRDAFQQGFEVAQHRGGLLLTPTPTITW